MQRSSALEAYLKRKKEEQDKVQDQKEIVIVPRSIKSVSSLLEKKSVSFSCLPSWCSEFRVYPSESIILWFRSKSDLDNNSATSCKLMMDDKKIKQMVPESTDRISLTNYWVCTPDIFYSPFILETDLVFNISILRANQGIFTTPEYFLPSFIPWKNRCDQTWTSSKYSSVKFIKFNENFVTLEYNTAQKIKLRQMQKEANSEHPENDYMVSFFELRIG